MKNNNRKQSAPNKNTVVINGQQKKKSDSSSYGVSFVKNNDMESRGQKSIYIRNEYHERLTRIVHVIGDN